MPQPPADKSIHFDRSQLRQPPKKSSSPFLKVLLAFVGCGFLMFACCAGWFGYNVYLGVQQARQTHDEDPDKTAQIASGEAGFDAANRQIMIKSGVAARGNSEAAIKLAEKFSEDIHTLREAFFTKRERKPLFSLSEGEFLTYCHLDDKACVFLVHVPDLRKFTKEAKSDLADLAWATAQHVARGNVENPPPRLGVGLRGVMFYDTAMIGKLQTDGLDGDGIDSRQSGSRPEELLYIYFKPAVALEGPVASDMPIAEETKDGDSSEAMPELDEADSTSPVKE
jgi:hypothetical protein